MHLAKSFESGLAIILIIAEHPKGVSVSARDIAHQLEVSPTYSQKLLRKLAVAGLVDASPGNNGGFKLGRPTGQISLADIITALEGKPHSFTDNGLVEKAMSEATTSKVNQAFQTADLVWQQVLSQTTLDRLIGS